MPGDRRDEDHREYGRLAAHAFDAIVVREDKNLRGRQPGRSVELVMDGIQHAQQEGGRCAKALAVPGELDAVVAAMKQAGPGDLVLLCSDDVTAVYRRVMEEARSRSGGAAIAHPGEFAVEEG